MIFYAKISQIALLYIYIDEYITNRDYYILIKFFPQSSHLSKIIKNWLCTLFEIIDIISKIRNVKSNNLIKSMFEIYTFFQYIFQKDNSLSNQFTGWDENPWKNKIVTTLVCGSLGSRSLETSMNPSMQESMFLAPRALYLKCDQDS